MAKNKRIQGFDYTEFGGLPREYMVRFKYYDGRKKMYHCSKYSKMRIYLAIANLDYFIAFTTTAWQQSQN